MPERCLGIDLGAETLKVVELTRDGDGLRWTRRRLLDHHKEPGSRLQEILADFDWDTVSAAAATGRFGRLARLPRIPVKPAQAAGYRFLHGEEPATVVSIGSHGFSVLELRASGVDAFRENSRCSQGTGNFLRQLVERFALTVEEASALSAGVADPAPLSGRCPVILKTDMTHLANKGEDRARILAGLYDAVCENVQVLLKPRRSPPLVVLTGGVSRSPRIRDHFRSFVARHGMTLAAVREEDLFLEAMGAALAAAESPQGVPPLADLLEPRSETCFEETPPLSAYLGKVRHMAAAPLDGDGGGSLVLGFDIGSTGSKAVAVDAAGGGLVWQGYRSTSGDPVGAAQALAREFLEGPAGGRPVVAVGATGSGREIVGSLLASCYGPDPVFVLNEIAAHARGALSYDPRVDTIFEIGGQDAKYIRLHEGRVVDAAMNEACSAGTGSFIEEQGRRFPGITDVARLGEAALAARTGVSLGQHCSVFMAEVLDEAVAAGVDAGALVAGIYDSVVLNYINRVKGARDVGRVVFCQGMPASAPALAAAVARHTGREVVVPPSPGTVGALGIALLTREQVGTDGRPALDPRRFLEARVEGKDAFVCRATRGCGGAGNRCRIECLRTVIAGRSKRFTWGGACSLHDRGPRRRALPDRAPDPFREREELVAEITRRMSRPQGGPRIGLTDEFVLKGLFPFFVTFFHELGCDPVVRNGAGRDALRRGIEESSVPFCAPLQLHHGLVSAMAEERPDFLFLPMVRALPRVGEEPHAVSCPLAQAAPDLLRWDLGAPSPEVLSPVIDVGPGNLGSAAFARSCARIAGALGRRRRFRRAYEAALETQGRFEASCLARGREALAFCAARGVVPVVVMGRPYTIHSPILNSNVPAILREQGALPIPVDCYPVDGDVPVFKDVYWGHGQRILRAAHRVRRAPGVYSLFCSNYSCGPDSFTLHFYAHAMAGKPFAVIETDGHSGDAGTKTRVEAFLHCVREDRGRRGGAAPARSIETLEADKARLPEFRRHGDTVLLVPMCDSVEALGACLRGAGLHVECLPPTDRDSLRLGRRHTSGKECLPLTLTLGSLLRRLEAGPANGRFVALMPTTNGPCRFGLYHLVQKVVFERLGLRHRIQVWSPTDLAYFEGFGRGFGALTLAGVAAMDLLRQALLDVRPVETIPGAAEAFHARARSELLRRLEREAARGVTAARMVREVVSGGLFGCAEVLRRTAEQLASVRAPRELPTVLVGGEIYVRCDPFASDFLVERLERRGLRVRLAPPSEWLEYVSDLAAGIDGAGLADRLSSRLQRLIIDVSYALVAAPLGWPPRTAARDAVAAAAPYVRPELWGEAVLTLGGALHEWRRGAIDGAVSVGPLECMPNKIAEAQLVHAGEREGLASLTLPMNGDPIDPEILDDFVYEVQARFRRRRAGSRGRSECHEDQQVGPEAGGDARGGVAALAGGSE